VAPVGEAEPSAPPRPITLPRASFVVLVIALVAAGVFGVLLLNTRINENAFRLDQLRSQQNSLDLQEQQLNEQLADLDSAGHLNAQAARLGLVPAGTPAFIGPDGHITGTAKPAKGSAVGQGTASDTDPGR
jgi:hypothetical protein